jgi:hypothetical protein
MCIEGGDAGFLRTTADVLRKIVPVHPTLAFSLTTTTISAAKFYQSRPKLRRSGSKDCILYLAAGNVGQDISQKKEFYTFLYN